MRNAALCSKLRRLSKADRLARKALAKAVRNAARAGKKGRTYQKTLMRAAGRANKATVALADFWSKHYSLSCS